MAMARESTFLPTIKCSSCGNEVEISMMGEHVCAGPAAEPSPPLDAFDNDSFNDASLPEKISRLPPPIDIRSTNDPYLSQGQLTPISQPAASRNISPNASTYMRPSSREEQDSRSLAPLPSPGHRPGGYGGFSDQPLPSPSLESKFGQSPGSSGGFLERMNSIAPGPFDANRRPSLAPQQQPARQGSFDRWNTNNNNDEDQPRPTTAQSVSNGGPGLAPPTRKGGYGGFGAPDRSIDPPPSMSALGRSETFPRPSFPTEAPLRTPSAPGSRPGTSGTSHSRQRSMGPDTSRAPPPRKSLIKPPKQNSVDLAAEFGIGNPYHTPSDSASSGYSTFSSQPSRTSTQTSPARSHGRRQLSDTRGDSAPRTVESLRLKELQLDPLAPQQRPMRTPSPLVESPLSTSPANVRADSYMSYRDPSPRAIPEKTYGTSPQPDNGPFGRGLQRTDTAPAWLGASPPSPRMAPPPRKGSIQPSRGDCKACQLPIKGKSISSADGRLTGKYHKACFVCTTCTQPFSSAEFYVLNDKPYCSVDYHRLNGSLCGSCSTGIEGQYLEDETSLKYHVGCFRCLDCGHSLPDGYYEVDGGVYCEQDALRRMAPPPPQPAAYQQRGPPGPPRGRAGPRPPLGLPSHPGPRGRVGGRGGPPPVRPPYGLPRPGFGPGGPGGPKLNKRMTRLGMM